MEHLGASVSHFEELWRAGRTTEIRDCLGQEQLTDCDEPSRVQLLIVRAAALYHLGDVVESIAALRQAVDFSKSWSADLQFAAAAALFIRESAFQSPDETLPGLLRLRQLATSLGDAVSLGSLHVAVARLEACRGNCLDARRHLQIARRVADQGATASLRASVD